MDFIFTFVCWFIILFTKLSRHYQWHGGGVLSTQGTSRFINCSLVLRFLSSPPTLDFYTPPLSFHAKPFFFVPHNSKMVLLDTITTFYLIFFFFSNSFKNNKIFWDYILHYNQYYAINVTYHSLKLNPLYVHM